MKHQGQNSWRGAVAALVLSALTVGAAGNNPQTTSYQEAFKGLPAPEIPARAAALVFESQPQDREEVTEAVVTAAVGRLPRVAAETAAAIARKVPNLAPTAAATAAELQPKFAQEIARATAAAAPDYACQIVAAVVQKLPRLFDVVPIEVARTVPEAGSCVLRRLQEIIPTLRPFLDRARVLVQNHQGPADSPVLVLAFTAALVQQAASSFRASVEQILAQGITSDQEGQLVSLSSNYTLLGNQGVRFVPGGGKPGETHRVPTVVVEKGSGRDRTDYSTP